MKNYQILIYDQVNNTTEKQSNFKGTEDELKQHLLKLQESYCEGEKPEIIKRKVGSEGGKFNVLFAASESDFCYMSVIWGS